MTKQEVREGIRKLLEKRGIREKESDVIAGEILDYTDSIPNDYISLLISYLNFGGMDEDDLRTAFNKLLDK